MMDGGEEARVVVQNDQMQSEYKIEQPKERDPIPPYPLDYPTWQGISNDEALQAIRTTVRENYSC